MKHITLHLLAIVTWTCATRVTAQSTPPPLSGFTESVVVSANATPTDLADLGASVTVIDSSEIESRKVTSVLELLRTVPGLEVIQGGGPGRTATVMIRGAASSHTLVLLDGLRLNSPATGAYDLSDLRSDQIERIEVLRGPQSSLYGSEAIGGVINLFTRSGGVGSRLQARGELGSASGSRLEATVGNAGEVVDYRVTASTERVGGISVASEARGNAEADPYRVASATGRLALQVGPATRGTLVVSGLDAHTALDGFEWGSGPVDDPNYTQDRRQVTAGLLLELDRGARVRHRLRLGGHDEALVGHDLDTAYNNYRIDSRSEEVTWQSDVSVGSSTVLSLGAGHEQRQAESRDAYDEREGVTSGFIESQWAVSSDVRLTAAVRHDVHSTFGSHTTARATLATRPLWHGLRAHASWGTAFKAPTFSDLFYPGFGNPELAPETSQGWEAGVGWNAKESGLHTELTWFEYRIDDLIGIDFQAWRAANIDRARVRGLEATGGIPLVWGARLEASYTLTDSVDLKTGLPLARRPRHRATVSATLALGERADATMSVMTVGTRFDSDGSRLPDYERVDASITYRLVTGISLHLRASNLLDQHYEELTGYTSPGLQGWVGLTVRP